MKHAEFTKHTNLLIPIFFSKGWRSDSRTIRFVLVVSTRLRLVVVLGSCWIVMRRKHCLVLDYE